MSHLAVDRGYIRNSRYCGTVTSMAGRPWFLAAADAADDSTELLAACAAGDERSVERLLLAGHKAHIPGQFFGETPSEQALEHGHTAIAARLLQAIFSSGESVNERFWRQLMLAAMKSGRLDALAFVLDFDPDLDGVVRHTEPPLFDAVRRGNAEMVALLLSAGAAVRNRDLIGNSLLHIAAKYGAVHVLPLLYESAVREDVDAADQQGNTALHYAVESLNMDVVRTLLIDFRADANARNRRQLTPLHFAIDKSRPKLVRLLLEEGCADVDARDQHGDTPLIMLTGLSASDIEAYPSSEEEEDDDYYEEDDDDGDDVDVAVDDGVADRDEASDDEDQVGDTTSMRVARVLLSFGADVNATNSSGLSALHQAMRRFDTDMMELLIAHGADVNAVNAFGDTPLHHAARLAIYPGIWQLLLVRGADPNVLDREGKTPLERVPNERLRESVREVLAAHAVQKLQV